MRGVPEFPLVERELTRAGRAVSTYLSRMYLTIVAFIIMLIVWFASERYGFDFLTEPDEIGRAFAILAMVFQYIVAISVAPGVAAPLLVHEKEERMLPLLLLAGRSHWDLVGAKYTTVLMQVVMLIVCILPLQAMAALLGGIDIAGIAWQCALLATIAAVACALGLYFSTVCRTATVAISLVQLVLVVWFAVTFLLDRVLAPSGAHTNLFTMIPAVAFSGTLGRAHLPALGVALLIGLWAYLRTVYDLPRQVLREAVARTPRRHRIGRMRLHGLWRLVAAGGDIARMGRVTPGLLLGFVALCIVANIPFVGWFILLLLYLRHVARGFAKFRASGALDDVLLTPQENAALVRAMFGAAMAGSLYFIVPVMLAIATGMLTPKPGWSDVPLFGGAARPTIVAWQAVLVGMQFVVCASAACLTATFPKVTKTAERFANLMYIGAVIVPILVPYLVLAGYAAYAGRYDYERVEPIAQFMFGSFALFWIALVTITAAMLMYRLAVKRIRSQLDRGATPAWKRDALCSSAAPVDTAIAATRDSR